MNTGNGSSISQEFAEKTKQAQKRKVIMNFAPLLILVVLIVVFGATIDSFLTIDNFRSIMSQMAIPLVLAVGLTFVIVAGRMDLSIEGVMALSASVVALLLLNNRNTLNMGVFGVVTVLLFGAGFGLLTGSVHVFGKIPSFIVSYGISNIARGLALLSYSGYPGTVGDETFRQLGLGTVLGAPIISWIAIGVFLIALFIQRYTPFGRYIFAIGQNEAVARTSGINVNKTVILTFVFCGVCVALAGVFGTALLGRGEANIGNAKAFPAITAVVVGGTPLSGGRGGVLNSLVGALIITMLQMGMVFYGVSPFIQTGVQGIIVLAAVAASVARDKNFIVK